MSESHAIRLVVNGVTFERNVQARLLLVDFLRNELKLTGTHRGCEVGACGACTVIFNGRSVNSCQLFAVQGHGAEITTIEGLQDSAGDVHPVQQAFIAHFALQCGYCTPGMILSAVDLLQRIRNPSDAQIRRNLAGNICRCTGYENAVRAVKSLIEDE